MFNATKSIIGWSIFIALAAAIFFAVRHRGAESKRPADSGQATAERLGEERSPATPGSVQPQETQPGTRLAATAPWTQPAAGIADDTIRQAIAEHRVIQGMTVEQIEAAITCSDTQRWTVETSIAAVPLRREWEVWPRATIVPRPGRAVTVWFDKAGLASKVWDRAVPPGPAPMAPEAPEKPLPEDYAVKLDDYTAQPNRGMSVTPPPVE